MAGAVTGGDGDQLLARARAGDADALGVLVARYLPRLRAFVRLRLDPTLRRRESSMDVVQSVCREICEHLPTLDDQGEQRFRGWLFVTALNKIREKSRHHRRARRDLGREQRADEGAVGLSDAYSVLPSPSRDLSEREALGLVESAFDRLSPDHQEVIALVRIAGLSHQAAAALMGRTVTATRQLLVRALVGFSRHLERLQR